MGDIRRNLFAPVVTESFAFLVEEYGCIGPVFSDDWPPNHRGGLDAAYHSRDFDVDVMLSVDYGRDAYVWVFLVRPPTNRSRDRRVDLLAHELGLAKLQSVPVSARTGYQLRHSLRAQAELTRRLLRNATEHP